VTQLRWRFASLPAPNHGDVRPADSRIQKLTCIACHTITLSKANQSQSEIAVMNLICKTRNLSDDYSGKKGLRLS
jgi:hypothetical protein